MIVETKVLPNNKQKIIRNSTAKTRKVIHPLELGGCGHIWETAEFPIVDDRVITDNENLTPEIQLYDNVGEDRTGDGL